MAAKECLSKCNREQVFHELTCAKAYLPFEVMAVLLLQLANECGLSNPSGAFMVKAWTTTSLRCTPAPVATPGGTLYERE